MSDEESTGESKTTSDQAVSLLIKDNTRKTKPRVVWKMVVREVIRGLPWQREQEVQKEVKRMMKKKRFLGWDQGRINSNRAMDHLPSEVERAAQNLKVVESQMWDTGMPGSRSRDVVRCPRRRMLSAQHDADEYEGTELKDKKLDTPKLLVGLPNESEEVKTYMSQHSIMELFRFLTSLLLSQTPASPLDVMIDVLHQMNLQRVPTIATADVTGIRADVMSGGPMIRRAAELADKMANLCSKASEPEEGDDTDVIKQGQMRDGVWDHIGDDVGTQGHGRDDVTT